MTSYRKGSVAALPSSIRVGAFQLTRTAPSRGSATTDSGSAGATEYVTETRRDGGPIRPCGSPARIT
jgi:hypothetical protein